MFDENSVAQEQQDLTAFLIRNRLNEFGKQTRIHLIFRDSTNIGKNTVHQ